MAQKCVHKACGKRFTDPDEPCVYHPGSPEFHEGQKGWTCCKPRVLTFDEFLDIPPCTTGKHSAVDETPAPPPKAENEFTNKPIPTHAAPKPYVPPPAASQTTSTTSAPEPPPPPAESDSDEPDATIPPNVTCKRRGCGASASQDPSTVSRDSETCVYHPGSPLFHEGSKGWTCCKRKVLEFDEFLKIEGCKTRKRHCFVGKKKAKRKPNGEGADRSGADGEVDEDWEKVESVRHDFYQTPTQVHATLYLKKVDKGKSKIAFKEDGTGLELDLKTMDGKNYAATWKLFGKVDAKKSSFTLKGTKVDLTLVKVDGNNWTMLRADEPPASTST